ncbi:TerC family protein [Fontisphaera persica]|uniref:TerC family protein n=1 Tax=Fontisphaera persica TaxID=2974023 RepID=UPI0024C05B89|nr:TerC family protein [Fontisphaera persica]WCJ59446.1 TerC family protein [Fontisphaera persica]
MLALAEITVWHWIGFITIVIFFLALDLGVFHKHAHVVQVKEAMAWTSVWFSMAMLFAGAVYYWRGRQEAVEFITGYVIEYSLSMDNVFVIAMIFAYFRVPEKYQHRVLFWGILGALIMRGIMIGAGSELVKRYHWILYFMGAFLIFSGIKMLFVADEGVHPEKNPVLKLARKLFPVTKDFHEQKFMVRLPAADGSGRLTVALTPLAMVLLMVETTDLIFAVDSIPAIFAITQKPFIVFTSNVFAILGLRSLYFLLAGAIRYFRYLKTGLSFVLVFIGLKMLLPWVQEQFNLWPGTKIPTTVSLAVVLSIILLSIGASVLKSWQENRAASKSGPAA